MAVAEGRVAQAESEGEERLAVAVDVFVHARRISVVIVGELADGLRKGDGEMPAGVIVAEERLRNGLAAELARVPRFKNCGNVLLRPVDGERAAVLDHKDDGLSGGDDGLKQLLLIAGKAQIGAVKALA